MQGFSMGTMRVPRWESHYIDPAAMLNLEQLDTRP